MLPDPLVVIGLGQLGTLFAEGFLKLGHPVVPVTRKTNLEDLETSGFDPRFTLLAVGEKDLPPLLAALRSRFRRSLGLVSNELREGDVARVPGATTLVVWFERKRGMPPRQVRPSVVSGPDATLLGAALSQFSLDLDIVESNRIAYELALKNLYILGLNLGGLLTRSETAEGLLTTHEKVFSPLLEELLTLEITAAKTALDRKELKDGFIRAIEADPTHGALGRSAPERLARTRLLAETLALSLPTIARLPHS